MFLHHYGLREQPFGVTPDPRFLFNTRMNQEALASLQYGIQEGRGFMALIAEPGMGKTTLLFQLLEQLRSKTRTAYLFHTQCDSAQMLASLVAELEYDGASGSSGGEHASTSSSLMELQDSLNRLLLSESQAGRTPVVIVDEAQNLREPVMETVRLLSNFETPRAKLLQIVMAGQPELGERLAQSKLSQLRQRISIVCRLSALDSAEVAPYIENRLRVAGYAGAPLFTPAAYQRIAQLSCGVPRNINNICFHALSIGCALGVRKIEASVLDEVAADLNWSGFSPSPSVEKHSESRGEYAAATSFSRPLHEPSRSELTNGAAEGGARERKPASSGTGVLGEDSLAASAKIDAKSQPAAKVSAPPATVAHDASRTIATPKLKPLPKSRYRIPLAVFLSILVLGLGWMTWKNSEVLALLAAPSASAASPAPQSPAPDSSGQSERTMLLQSPDSAETAETPKTNDAAAPPKPAPVFPSAGRRRASQPSVARHDNSTAAHTESMFAPEVLLAPLGARSE
jgi:general secretion pathway protein A